MRAWSVRGVCVWGGGGAHVGACERGYGCGCGYGCEGI